MPKATAKLEGHKEAHKTTSRTTASPASQQCLDENGTAKMKDYLDSTDKPFKIAILPHSKKRKRGQAGESEAVQTDLWEDRLAVQFQVRPRDRWDALRKYKKFTVGDESIAVGQTILVKHDDSDVDNGDVDLVAHWKARVLEVRALDTEHVYLRVAWLYRPEDLITGRKSYHGALELIPSNELDIIDGMACNGSLDVVHWDETDDAAPPLADDQFFWRQTYDYAYTKTYSELRKICIDEAPQNPDELILQCSNKGCREWQHAWCMADDALQTYLTKQSKTMPKKKKLERSDGVAAEIHDRQAAVSLGHPKDEPNITVDLFVAGVPSDDPAEKSAVRITPTGGAQITDKLKCLFCGAKVD